MSTFAELEAAPVGTTRPLAEVLAALRFNEAGLLPAIAQDAGSGEVLMLAWMNRDALEATLRDGCAWYYSRSRRRLWRKGESSGHVQKVLEMRLDCDGDTILLRVEQTGPACHTNRPNCFYMTVDTESDAVRITSQP